MPAYNFKARFSSDVKAGRKLHTIRPKRKNPTKPGDKLVLYTGMRTKKCELLRITTCTGVEPVSIRGREILVGGVMLTESEAQRLATGDGFENATEFFAFFEETYPNGADDMELITWPPLDDVEFRRIEQP